MKLVELSYDVFDEFAKRHPQSSFFQSAAMATSYNQLGFESLIYGVEDQGEIIAAGMYKIVPVILHYKIAFCTWGPLLDYGEQELIRFYFSQLVPVFRKKGIFSIVIKPNFPVVSRDENGEITDEFDHRDWKTNLLSCGIKEEKIKPSDARMFDQWGFVKDFTDIHDDQALLQSMNQDGRRVITKTRKSSLEIIESNDDLSDFFKVMNHTADRRSFENREEAYFTSMTGCFGQDSKILLAKIDPEREEELVLSQMNVIEEEIARTQAQIDSDGATKKRMNKVKELNFQLIPLNKRLELCRKMPKNGPQTIAGAFFLYYGDEIFYTFSGAYEEYYQFDAPYALQDAAFQWGLAKGIRKYNFMGTTGKYYGAEDEGVYLFKKGFGGYVIERPGIFEIEVIPLINRAYHKAKSLQR